MDTCFIRTVSFVPRTRTIKNVNTWYFHTKTSTPIDCLSTYFYRSLVRKTVCFGLYIDKKCVPVVFSESPLNTDTRIIRTLWHVPLVSILTGFHCPSICSTQKLLWIPLFHVHGSRTPSFWVTRMTCCGSVDVSNQRLHQELVYRNKPFKEMITTSIAFSPLQYSPAFFFVFALSQFSEPDHLGAWNRLHHGLTDRWPITSQLNQSLMQKTDVIPLTLILKMTTIPHLQKSKG